VETIRDRRSGNRLSDRDGTAAAFGSIVVLAVALALTPLRDTIGATNAALILTLVVVGAAAAGGRVAGATTAVVGSLGFNAGFAPPYGTLRIASPEDVLTCVLMVVVGVAVGQLAHLATVRGRRSSRDRVGLSHLSDLRDLVTDRAPIPVIIERSRTHLVQQLGLASCFFVHGASRSIGFGDLPPDLDRHGSLPPPASGATLRHGLDGFELPEGGVSLPVLGRDGTVLGRFVLEPTPGRGVARADRELAVLVADTIAPALEPDPNPPTDPPTTPLTNPRNP